MHHKIKKNIRVDRTVR